MNANGVEITEAQIDAAILIMQGGKFTAHSIQRVLRDVGVRGKDDVVIRASDLIFQKQKKAGNIVFDKSMRTWSWVG